MEHSGRRPSLPTYEGAAFWLALVAIVILAAFLRTSGLTDNPGWFSDEGTHLAIARSLLVGDPGYLAVDGSPLLFAKLPLFDWLLALAARLGSVSPSMAVLRYLSAGLGVITVVLLAVVTRILSGQRFWPLLPAAALAVLPPAVLYNRLGFSYNLVAPLLVIAWFGLAVYARNERWRYLALAALAVGLGGLTDLWMWSVLPLLVVVGLAHHPRHLPSALALALLPSLLVFGWHAAADGAAFLFDLRFTLGRLSGAGLGAQLRTLGQNLTVLLFQDAWFALGLIGLWRLPFARGITLAFLLLPILILGRTVALYHLSAYYLIPLFPFMALGLGQLATDASRYLAAWAATTVARPLALRYAATAVALSLFVGLPAGLVLRSTWQQSTTGWQTALDPFLVPAADARAAAGAINQRARPDDLTIASPAVAWLLDGRVADFQMAVAATGVATPHLPADIPRERWRFDPRFAAARFLVVDGLWDRWATVHVPGVSELLSDLEGWTLLLASGEVRVYERAPAR